MNDIDTLTANVERGATWLDDVRLGWYLEIDVADLDLGSPVRCVLGQVAQAVADELGVDLSTDGFTLFLEGPRNFSDRCVLQLLQAAGPLGDDESIDLGFDLEDEPFTGFDEGEHQAQIKARFRVLDDLWIKAIKRRVDA